MVKETQQLKFNLDLESSKDKARKRGGKCCEKPRSKKDFNLLDQQSWKVIENAEISLIGIQDLYLTKQQRENMNFQRIQPENGLKA